MRLYWVFPTTARDVHNKNSFVRQAIVSTLLLATIALPGGTVAREQWDCTGSADGLGWDCQPHPTGVVLPSMRRAPARVPAQPAERFTGPRDAEPVPPSAPAFSAPGDSLSLPGAFQEQPDVVESEPVAPAPEPTDAVAADAPTEALEQRTTPADHPAVVEPFEQEAGAPPSPQGPSDIARPQDPEAAEPEVAAPEQPDAARRAELPAAPAPAAQTAPEVDPAPAIAASPLADEPAQAPGAVEQEREQPTAAAEPEPDMLTTAPAETEREQEELTTTAPDEEPGPEVLIAVPTEAESPQEVLTTTPADEEPEPGVLTALPAEAGPEPRTPTEVPLEADREVADAPDEPLPLGSRSSLVKPIEPVTLERPWTQCQAVTDPGLLVVDEDAPTPARGGAPTTISADYTQGTMGTDVVFSGDVRVERADQRIGADEIRYDQEQNRLNASGNIEYREQGLIISAQQAELDFEGDRGTMNEVEYRLASRHARGEAAEVEIEGGERSRYKKVSYTTCEPGNEDWVLKAKKLKLDTEEGVGTARNVTLRFKGVPLLYTPFATFPIDDRRKSGFLAPSLGQTDSTGVDTSIPYYWNIAPNYDATITPRLTSRRGAMISAEGRYLSVRQQGEIAGEFIADDSERDNGSRGQLTLKHFSNPTQRLRTELNYNYVSDRDYLEDFGNNLSITSIRQLERRADLRYFGERFNVFARVLDFQPIARDVNSETKSYGNLPRVQLNGRLPSKYVDTVLYGETVNFDRSETVEGWRADLYPQFTKRLFAPGYLIQPKVGFRYTKYWLSNAGKGEADSPDRSLPTASVDARMFFDRNTAWGDVPMTHTLEPRIYYLLVENENQDEFPLFDTDDFDFSFSQLFRENRFTGADRIGDANQLTVALTSLHTENASGRTWLSASIGSIFYFRDRKVTLRTTDEEEDDSTSSVVTEISANMGAFFNARGSYQYDPHDERSERGNLRIQYRRDSRHIINAAYRMRRTGAEVDFLEQTDLSARWPLFGNWRAVGRWNYSLRDSTSLDTFGGIEYESCCWGFRAVFRQFANEDNVDVKENAVMLQLVLKGLTGIGNDIDSFLEEGILGYQSEEYY